METVSGWIEIFNPTANVMSLSGWALTDDPATPLKWRFPNVSVAAHSYFVVFASGKNRTGNLAELHTNFKLAPAGGYLALVNSGGSVVSVFDGYPPQQPDVSYGRDNVNPALAGYFPKPTPDDPNSTSGANFSPAVAFSRAGGTFVTAFNLQLTTTATNAVIRYTLDGSAPTEDAAAYSAPIGITSSTQVRARAFVAGLMPGPLQGASYLQLAADVVSMTSDLPIVALYDFGGGAAPQTGSLFLDVSVYEPQNGATSLTNAATLSTRAGFSCARVFDGESAQAKLGGGIPGSTR